MANDAANSPDTGRGRVTQQRIATPDLPRATLIRSRSMELLYLDMAGNVLSQKTLTALRKKYNRTSSLLRWTYGDHIHSFDFSPVARLAEMDEPFIQEPAFVAAKRIVTGQVVDKIMVATHGQYSDTEYGYHESGLDGQTRLIRHDRLAKLMNALLEAAYWSNFWTSQSRWNITLVTCYAARAEDFGADHRGVLRAEQIRSSFAFKLFKGLCRCARLNIKLAAWTGAVGFNGVTGHSEVQTEEAVFQNILYDELQRDPETERINVEHEQGLSELHARLSERFTGSELKNKMSTAIDGFMRDDPRGQKYQAIKDRVNVLQQGKDADSIKYGKFVYEYNVRTRKYDVCRKYPEREKLLQGFF